MKKITRRHFLRYGVAGGAALLFLVRVGSHSALAQVPGGTLPPGSIPKYVTSLVIPPAMPRTSRITTQGGKATDYYEIAVRQFQQHILPQSMGLPPTTVWSYGSVTYPATFNYPAFTIEAKWQAPVRVKWMNQLVDANGNYLPHLLPIDQTLRWANPPGGPVVPTRKGLTRCRTEGRFRSSPICMAAFGRGERRLRRGLVPAGGEQHPGGLRHRRIALRHVQGRGRGAVRAAVDAGECGLSV